MIKIYVANKLRKQKKILIYLCDHAYYSELAAICFSVPELQTLNILSIKYRINFFGVNFLSKIHTIRDIEALNWPKFGYFQN